MSLFLQLQDSMHEDLCKLRALIENEKKERKMGIAVNEFCALVDIVTARHGEGVMVSVQDKEGHMHLTKEEKHLGYIDIITGSLVWDQGEA